MAEKDDSFVADSQLISIKSEARKALLAASALGVYPTPVERILEASRVSVETSASLNEGFLSNFYRRATGLVSKIKRAISKLVGFLDIRSRSIFLDSETHESKKKFVKLHEFGHFSLPWQRDVYCYLEDSEEMLDEEVRDEFEREANNFAVEVLFQLGSFEAEAKDLALGLKAPIELSKRYGASIYSAIRRYVRKNHLNCSVLVLNLPIITDTGESVFEVRRVEASPSFTRQFGALAWPSEFSSRDVIGRAAASIGRWIRNGGSCTLTDQNGTPVECYIETFSNKYQIFILLFPPRQLSRVGIVTAGSSRISVSPF